MVFSHKAEVMVEHQDKLCCDFTSRKNVLFILFFPSFDFL